MSLQLRQVLTAGVSGGIILLILTFVADWIVQFIAPYNIFDVPGMRSMGDPIGALFFVYPIVFSLIVAYLWTWIRVAFPGEPRDAGVRFGAFLFILIIVPNCWVIFTSMNYPAGFFFSNILTGLFAYPVMGYINARYNS